MASWVITFRKMPYKDKQKEKEYHAQYYKKWAVDNRDKIHSYQKKHYPIKAAKRKTQEGKKQLREVRYRRHHRNKVWVLEQYGKKCAYCGCDIYEHLVVDHIHNDGAKERQTELYNKTNCGGMYGYLKNNNIIDKDKYQILCHNCNASKQHYNIVPDKDGNLHYKPFEHWKEISKLRGQK